MLISAGIFSTQGALAQHVAPASTAVESKVTKSELIFQTGFGGTLEVIPKAAVNSSVKISDYRIENIVDKYTSLAKKSNWHADTEENPALGRFFIEYAGGSTQQRYARIIPELGHPQNKVLRFWLGNYWNASEG